MVLFTSHDVRGVILIVFLIDKAAKIRAGMLTQESPYWGLNTGSTVHCETRKSTGVYSFPLVLQDRGLSSLPVHLCLMEQK